MRVRWVVVTGWVAAAIGCVAFLPSLEEAQSGALGDLVPADSRALKAEQRMRQTFGFPLFSRTAIVARDASGLDPAARVAPAQRPDRPQPQRKPPFEDVLGALPLFNGLDAITAPERGTGVLAYLFISPDVGQRGRAQPRRSARRKLALMRRTPASA